MRLIGFSTGSLALGNFQHALKMMEGHELSAIELSALRETELDPLLIALDQLDLSSFRYISVHAPSRLEALSEMDLVNRLYSIIERGYPVVVHPDIIQDYECWTGLGDMLCLENMDKRKATGRSVGELACMFDYLPRASMCLDLAHTRQVDPTMSQAVELLSAFGDRLRQLHVSEVNSQSAHGRLTAGAVGAFRAIAAFVPPEVPIILESPVTEAEEMDWEVQEAMNSLSAQESHSLATV